jgi:hypothetical protein
MSQELMNSLMSLGPGTTVPGGQPLRVGENPMLASVSGQPGVPAATTPGPQLNSSPAKKSQSLEDILFGGGF